MDNHFVKLSDTDSFEHLLKLSTEQPVVIFKHSTSCSVSASAYRELSRCENEVNLVEVQSSRELSNRIESDTGVRHESPQVLVLRNGKVVWKASHWSVTSEAVNDAVRASR